MSWPSFFDISVSGVLVGIRPEQHPINYHKVMKFMYLWLKKLEKLSFVKITLIYDKNILVIL